MFSRINLEFPEALVKAVCNLMAGCVSQNKSIEIVLCGLPKFPILSYSEAMQRLGTDQPDLRNPLESTDVTEILIITAASSVF